MIPVDPNAYRVPIAPADLTEIASRLRTRDVFTPSFACDDVDRYDPVLYRHQSDRFGISTRLLVDRNLLSRWVAVVNGVQPQESHRLAAAVLAFAQCANMEIEPNIALYEVAHRCGVDVAREELATFRFADITLPGYWAEVALGTANGVVLPDVVMTRTSDDTVDFAMPLRRWRRNYALTLKVGALELEGGRASDRFSRLVKWMYDHFLLGGPAIALGAIYLAPNAARRGLLKGIRSADREHAINGLRNAAWDLTIVSEWVRAAEAQEADARLTLLASLDRAVHNIARAVADISVAQRQSGSRLAEVLAGLWGEPVGSRLAEEVASCYSAREAPHRRINQDTEADWVSTCIACGEDAIRRWSPSANA